MDVISDIAFSDEMIELDGKHFKDCSLTNCWLTYSGGSVIFENTSIISCRHDFRGSARQTISYLQTVGLIGDGHVWINIPDSIH